MWNQDNYQKAIVFAGYKHRNQLVPGKEYNYVVHISNVAAEIAAAICIENIGDEDFAIQCALLHDVIEDTETTIDEVKEEFGEKVLSGVLALTKNEEIEKSKQIIDSLGRIKKSGREIACVKMADRITNLQKPPEKWNEEKKKKYRDEALVIYKELKDYSKVLSERLFKKIHDYKSYIAEDK